MTNYQRLTAKVFGETATATGDNPEIGQFGSALAGTYVGTTDVATIQNLTAWSNGFIDCVTPENQFPPLPEITGFGKVLSYHEAYLLQKGIPEWDSATTYYQDDFCRVGHTVYYSLQDGNINHNPTTDAMYWKDFTIGANQELSNLVEAGEDRLHALKGYLESGQSYTDTTLYNDVCSYNHSTFDVSKFTKVGSPIITDDGIASGFSSSNKISASLSLSGSKLIAKCGFYYKVPSASGSVIGLFNGGTSCGRCYVSTSGNIVLNVPNASSDYIAIGSSDLTLTANDFIIATLELTENSTFKLTVLDTNTNETITKTSTANWNKTVDEINAVYCGSSGSSEPYEGSIDLKQFSITVDGYPVFSGNKTGIDTIKPDDYTVVGTPTISADGVASGVSGNDDKITSTIDVTDLKNKSWSIQIKQQYRASQTDYYGLYLTNRYPSIGMIGIKNTSSQVLIGLFGKIDSTEGALLTENITNTTIQDGDFVNIRVDFDYPSLVSRLYISKNTEPLQLIKTETKTNQLTALDTSNLLKFSCFSSGGNAVTCNCQTDLNLFEIYVNGNLVYQPCLLIPYTESSTGSKIVDVAYRDRVIDVYKQYGSALYYTIDETNQNATLPMGEVYGFIEQKASTDFDNVTQTAIDKALDWIMPDWSRAVNKNPYETYTATQRGWVNAQGYTNQDEIGVKINSNVVAYTQAPGGTGDDSGFACLVPVNVGDQYETYVVNGYSTNERIDFVKFIPCKGEA